MENFRLVVAIVLVGCAILGQTSNVPEETINAATALLAGFFRSDQGKDLAKTLYPKGAGEIAQKLGTNTGVQKLKMFIGSGGGLEHLMKIYADAQVNTVLTKLKKKEITIAEFFTYLGKLCEHLPGLRKHMTELMKGTHKALLKEGAVSYSGRTRPNKMLSKSCPYRAKDLLISLTRNAENRKQLENDMSYMQMTRMAAMFAQARKTLLHNHNMVSIATNPIAALISAKVWSETLNGTMALFSNLAGAGSQAELIAISTEVLRKLNRPMRKLKQIGNTLVKEVKKVESGKKACVTRNELQGLIKEFKKYKNLAKKFSSPKYKALGRFRSDVKLAAKLKKSQMLPYLKVFVSKEKQYEEVRKDFEKIKKGKL